MARCDSYYPGQCTAGACQENGWVEDGWGNGGEWANSARAAGFAVTMIPTAGAVVCYCEGNGYSEFGHVASVTQVFGDGTFEVSEENYIGPYQWDNRRSTQYDVCGFILSPGGAPGAPGSPPLGQGAGTPTGYGVNIVSTAWSYFANVVSKDLPNMAGEIESLGNSIRSV